MDFIGATTILTQAELGLARPTLSHAGLDFLARASRGPHTVDARNGKVALDLYVEKSSLWAGYRLVSAVVHLRFRRVDNAKGATGGGRGARGQGK